MLKIESEKVKSEIAFGHFLIKLPDESSLHFTIFEDLAELFGTQYQSEAVEIVKVELDKLELKPKLQFDYESDYTQIDCRNADGIFIVSKIIFQLTLPQKKKKMEDKELEEIYSRLKKWKRQPKQKWKVGDVFSIPLLDGSFSFGQIVGTHLTSKIPILALFEIK